MATMKNPIIDSNNTSSSVISYPAESPELLCLILDLSPYWFTRTPESTFLNFLDAIIAFSVAYLTLSVKKELAIIGVVPEKSDYIYTTEISSDTVNMTDGKVRLFQSVDNVVRANISRLMQHTVNLVNSVNLSGALIKSLCYYNKRNQNLLAQTTQQRLNGRFVIVRTSVPDSSCCFMSMMNGLFSAQKLGICIDVCLLADDNDEALATASTTADILRQSADSTGGIHLRVVKQQTLLQNLFTLFLPSGDDREYMTMISRVSAEPDFRASCFCHGKLISLGYVCSLCLAVFCRYSPLCRCCVTLFKDKKLRFITES